jgi:ribosome biogenesis SPOUT family RNA methylase Rps3
MMIVNFDYTLHDDADSIERLTQISESAEIEIDDELADKIGRPFHEVTLRCSLDTETGKVMIHGTSA